MKKEYETVIGLEVHVELATKTKIFCGCSTEFEQNQNTHTCPVCTGMPGSLPVFLNKKVVEYAMSVGLAANCVSTSSVNLTEKLFLPGQPAELPDFQLYLPICHDGYIQIDHACR